MAAQEAVGANRDAQGTRLPADADPVEKKVWFRSFADDVLAAGLGTAMTPILGPDGRPLGLTQPGGTWNSPGAYPCPQCGKVYRWRGNLNLHLRQECGKEPQFQCPHCPHRSKQKSNLKTHILNIHGPTGCRRRAPSASRDPLLLL